MAEDTAARAASVITRCGNQFLEAADVLGDAIQRARAKRAVKAQENAETDAKAETVSDSKPLLASLLLAGREE
jgi:hypothetical protein